MCIIQILNPLITWYTMRIDCAIDTKDHCLLLVERRDDNRVVIYSLGRMFSMAYEIVLPRRVLCCSSVTIDVKITYNSISKEQLCRNWFIRYNCQRRKCCGKRSDDTRMSLDSASYFRK